MYENSAGMQAQNRTMPTQAQREMNRVDELERALEQVDTVRRRLSGIVSDIEGGPANLVGGTAPNAPRPVRSLAAALNEVPAAIEGQCAECCQSIQRIREILKL